MKSKKANNAEKLLEATMLALQGKLELKENKTVRPRVRTKSRAKKNESIDVNVDEKTNVSVEGNETVVDTEDATVVINKKDNFVPETSDGIIDTNLPSVEAPVEDLPIETPETVEVPTDDTIMPEEILDEPVDTELPEDDEEETPSIDEMVDESKKLEEDINHDDLVQAGTDLWGEGAVVNDTIVDGIYDCYTNGHGGYLIDTDIFPQLKKYGEETSIDNIVGFEEDYEALKILWIFPMLINNEDFKNKLNLDMVLRYESSLNDEFRKDFPTMGGSIEVIEENKKVKEEEKDNIKLENRKLNENIEIEISEDGKEVEVKTDDGEEVEVKDETPDEEGDETKVPADDEPSTDEMIEESKKVEDTEEYLQPNNKDVSHFIDYGIDNFDKFIDEVGISNIEKLYRELGIKTQEELDKEFAYEEIMNDYENEQLCLYELNNKEYLVYTDIGYLDLTNSAISRNKKFLNKLQDTNVNNTIKRFEESKKVLGKYIKESVNRKKLKENKYSDSTWYEYDVDGTRFNFFCRSWSTSRSWGHEVELKDGYRTIGNARCTYYNRTWESFEYQTCMLKAISDAEKNGYDKEKLDKLAEQVKTGKGLTENKEQCEDCKNGTCECKKTESNETPKMDTNDLGINEGVPKKEEPVPNTDTKIEEKFSSKTFEKALTEFLKREVKDIDNVKVEKIIKSSKGLKIEATISRNTLTKPKKVTLEMLNIQKGSSFNKYKLKESKSIIVENKKESSEITMLTFKNKQNILECRYFTKNK